MPKAGSAYVYSYVTVGEFVAFTIGWNLILEYVIGTSSVARGLIGYIDTLVDDKIGNFMRETLPINIDFLAEYPDFLSFIVVMLVSFLLALGVKESTWFNNVFTLVNLATLSVVMVFGALKTNTDNWQIDKENIPAGIDAGNGGFMPYGVREFVKV